MLQVAIGHSNDPDSAAAAAELIAACQAQLGDRNPAAGLLFAAIDYDHAALLRAIDDTWPGLPLAGCTTDGEISSQLDFQQDSVVLTLFCSDDIHFAAGLGEDVSRDPVAAGRRAVERAMAGLSGPPKLCILLPESLTADGLEIIEGVRQALPAGVPISGGLAADQWRFVQTRQFHGTSVHSDAAAVLLLAGPLRCAHGVASGWKPIGEPARIDQSSGVDVQRIGGRTALDFYRDHLGIKHAPSSNYPLAVYDGDQVAYLRAPSGEFDEATGSVNFFAKVPAGATVRMSESTRDEVLAATRDSLRQALDSYPGSQPAAALFFSCASRRQLLGTRTGEEFALIRADAPGDLPAAGFYTNGEISPLAGSTGTLFHNETFITLLLGTD